MSTDTPPSTNEVTSPQAAALLLRKSLTWINPHGFDTYVMLPHKKKIDLALSSTDFAHVCGLLEGVTAGNLSCGDARISGGIVNTVNALKAIATRYQKMADDPEKADKKDENLEIVKHITGIGHAINSAYFNAAKFGLTQDKMPLESYEVRSTGFNDDPHVGRTGRFVSSLNR